LSGNSGSSQPMDVTSTNFLMSCGGTEDSRASVSQISCG
jgi:hypothetical protein